MTTESPARLDGVFSVVPTPFTDDGALDEAGVAALARAHVDAGVAGLVLLGVMGEAAELDESERTAILATARRAAPGTTLIVGVTAPSAEVVRERAAGALDAGASVLMVSPAPDVPLSEAVAAAASAGLPIVVQDYPVASGVTLTAEEIAAAAAAERKVIAVKVEAPPTSGKIATLAGLAPDLGLLGGLGGLLLLDELAAGATGAMTGFAMPERLVEIVRAWPDAPERATAVWRAVLPLMRLEAFTPLNLAVRKEVWRLRGVVGSSYCRRKGVILDDRARADIERAWRSAELAAAAVSPAPGAVGAGAG